MLFHFEMMDNIKINFCNALKKWVDTNFKGIQKELGKFFGVSQGYISNVMAGRRGGDETFRRYVAAKIGMDYDAMIGIEKPNNNIVRFESAEDKRHYEIIKSFGNKPLAITINEMLSEIEQIAPENGLDKAMEQLEMVKAKIETDVVKKRGRNKK
jgi:predicted transcriptional regulator